MIFDFRVSADWGYNEDSNQNVVYIKKWQKIMRRDMADLFAKETEPDLYKVDRYFWENNSMRKGDDFSHEVTIERILSEHCWQDLTPLLTRMVLYWSKVGDLARSDVENLWGNNLNQEQREHAYLGWYANKNIPQIMYNHGYIDDDGFVYYSDESKLDRQKSLFYCREDFDDAARKSDIRAKSIAVKHMIKWFASDEGQKFVTACEDNIEIKKEREGAKHLPQYSTKSPVQQWLAQRP